MAKILRPNYGQAVLRPLDEGEQTFGNIIIPDMGKETAKMGTILAIAPIYNFNRGELVPSIFKIGDLVILPPMGAQKVTVDKIDYLLVSTNDLLSSIEEE